MIDAGYFGRFYSVAGQRAAQRWWNTIGIAALLFSALAFGGLLASGISASAPVLLLVASAGFLAAGIIWRKPVLALYILVFAALAIEQWPIAGLRPITTQTHFFQSLSGFTPLPFPIMPADLVLGVALLAILLPALARGGAPFYKGFLFGPIILFLIAVAASFAYGTVRGPAGTSFYPNAAWVEVRSFLHLAAAYFLACNVITNRNRLVTVVWLIIFALGFKGLQGLHNYLTMRQLGLRLEAITGHEDVVFFASFFILLVAMTVYGCHRRQRQVMLLFLLPLIFTDLVTSRRIAFFVLAAGFLIFAFTLLKTRKQLLFKILPPVIILLGAYTAIFWNNTGTALGQPVRAFKSQLGYKSERDTLSDRWRDLENTNISLNIQSAPITGLGFGRPYRFFVAQPSLDETGFVYWAYITHNAIFWVWMKMGIIGFIAFWYLLGSAIVRGLITFRQLSSGYLKALAVAAVSLVVMQIFFAYGDLGLTYARNMIYLGCMLGLLVRLPDLDREPVRELSGPVT